MSYERAFDRHYDALIVGARPAGAATAMLLARMGLKVLTIDRESYGSDTLSTHALMRGAVMQLARWDLLDAIIGAGTPAIKHTTVHYGDAAIGFDVRPENGIDALFAPRRTVLDRVLVDGARSAGAHIHHGTALSRLEYGTDGRVIGASIQGRDGVEHSVRADIVIGADGRHSTIAGLINAQKYRLSQHYTATAYGYFTGLKDEGFRWYYRPGVSAGAIPTNDGNTCVFVFLPPDRFRREMAAGVEALFDTILAETSSDFAAEVGRAPRLGHLRGFPGEEGYFRQSFGPGWALVGDAGYFKDPLTGHGITDALRDAELLALAVADGSAQALERYQAERDALSLDLFRATDAIASFKWDIETLRYHHGRLTKAMRAETAALAVLGAPVMMAA